MAIEEKKNWIVSDLFQLKTDHFRNPIIFHPFWNCYPVSIPRYDILLLSDNGYHLAIDLPVYDSIFAHSLSSQNAEFPSHDQLTHLPNSHVIRCASSTQKKQSACETSGLRQ